MAENAGLLPRHVAVVMDGNGRWAQQRGLSRIEGHVEGRKAAKRLVQACADKRMECLTIYAFSTENWKRSDDEVTGLMALMEAALAAEVPDLQANSIRFRASGRTHELPDSFQETIRRAEEETKTNDGLLLSMAVNYSGRAEIVDVCRKLAHDVTLGRIAPNDITDESVIAKLYLPESPEVDLLIRPGGEMRVSNFLLWQIAYAEIFVMDLLWPDFQVEHLNEAIRAYQDRDRRFGGVPDL